MSEANPAVINEEDFSISRTIRINANQHKVWAAITTPELIVQWFGQRAFLPDLSVGATGTLGWEHEGDFPILITAVDEPSVFAYRWANTPGEIVRDDNSTLVTFTLAADGEQTVLTVIETGFGIMHPDESDRRKHLDENQDGWTEELDELIALMESDAP
jgi:uncharacterized protein YndB with AHSA1/START domain